MWRQLTLQASLLLVFPIPSGSVPTPQCVKIITSAPGFLDVSVETGNGLLVQTSGVSWVTGQVVLENCYDTLVALRVQSPSQAGAWVGTVQISEDNGTRYGSAVCTTCTMGEDGGSMLVSSAVNGGRRATTQCLGGMACTLRLRTAPGWVVEAK